MDVLKPTNLTRFLSFSLILFFSLYSIFASTNLSAKPAIKSNKATTTLLLDAAKTKQHIVAVGWRGHIVLSNDNGKSWQQVIPDTQFLLSAIVFINDNLGWAVGHNSTIIKTDDGGLSWKKQYEDVDLKKALFDVWFSDPLTGWAVGSLGLVMHTTDGGRHWQDISDALYNPDQYHYYGIEGSSDGHIYIVGERDFTMGGGLIFHSKNAGQTWRQLPPTSPGTLFGVTISPIDANVYVYGILGNLYRSKDGGNSFNKIALATRETITNLKFGNRKQIIAVGAKGLVINSNDGDNFDLRYEPARNDFTAVLPIDANHALVTGPAGLANAKLP